MGAGEPQILCGSRGVSCYEGCDSMAQHEGSFEIMPYQAGGAIRFGMTSSQVRQVLHTDPRPRPPASPAGADNFDQLGIRVYYRLPDSVEAIEFNSPACPTLHGRPLLRQRYGDLESWIQSMDPGTKLEHSGLTSNALGIRLYASSARRNPDAPVESVTVFEKDYYRRYIESILPPPPS